jgi:heterodisulfide reductase subunit A-like polyferredoxin
MVKVKQALVLGAGVAGMSTALGLAERGIFVNLVDTDGAIGGRSRELSCKGLRECVRCDVCLATDMIQDVGRSNFIRVFRNSRLRGISGEPGNFRATLSRSPEFIDEGSCTACGECLFACPAGAIHGPGVGIPLAYSIDPEACLHMRGEDCRSCEEACPQGAVDLSAGPSTKRLQVGTVVVATGFTPFDPDLEPRLGHDQIPGVISSLEAERSLGISGRLDLSDGSPPERLAFIQCVGSRDLKRGVEYCSKVCCKYSMGIGRMLRALHPDLAMTYFIMDWRPYDLESEDLRGWATIDPAIRVIRSRPSEIITSPTGDPVVRYTTQGEDIAEDEFDMVILSVGMTPSDDLEGLASLLELALSPQRFIDTDVERPAKTSRPGIFAAGCCTGPKDIEESAMEGNVAAGEAASFLEGLL